MRSTACRRLVSSRLSAAADGPPLQEFELSNQVLKPDAAEPEPEAVPESVPVIDERERERSGKKHGL